jgi:hypothetical protein
MSDETKTTEDTIEATNTSADDPQGAFFDSLTRNNRKIRRDRAIAIAEDAELIYGRQVQDLEVKLKRMKRERENMLDLSPTNAQSLVLATDFDAEEYVKKDIALGVDIRNTEIKLEIAKAQYQHLFGGN